LTTHLLLELTEKCEGGTFPLESSWNPLVLAEGWAGGWPWWFELFELPSDGIGPLESL